MVNSATQGILYPQVGIWTDLTVMLIWDLQIGSRTKRNVCHAIVEPDPLANTS